MNITEKQRAAAEDAVGWEVSDKDIEDALAAIEGTPTHLLEDQLERLVNRFEAAGGRGIELADEIDTLRIAVAARKAVDD